MSITSYFFPISKAKSKRVSATGSVSRTTSEGKAKPRPAPYPETAERKPSQPVTLNVSQTPSSSSILTSSTSNPDTTSFSNGNHPRYMNLKRIAEETIEAVESGSFQLGGTIYDLKVAVNEMRSSTEFWSPDSKRLASWAATRVVRPDIRRNLDISLHEISSLEGSRFLAAQISAQYFATTASSYFSSSTATPAATPKIGLLNFASATKPGGGFLNGASAQEESIARSSTLYYSLTTRNADEFYKLHKRMKHNGKWNGLVKGKKQDPSDAREQIEGHNRDTGFYTHAMIYSPSVLLFRDDTGSWLKPLPVDVLTSAAVNAGDIRTKHHIKNATKSEKRALEARIEKEMKERMARILHIFALKGVRNLVLGSFGTGVFKNNVEVVARLWKELLLETGAPFEKSFDRVVFAVLGKETYETFEEVLQLDS